MQPMNADQLYSEWLPKPLDEAVMQGLGGYITDVSPLLSLLMVSLMNNVPVPDDILGINPDAFVLSAQLDTGAAVFLCAVEPQDNGTMIHAYGGNQAVWDVVEIEQALMGGE